MMMMMISTLRMGAGTGLPVVLLARSVPACMAQVYSSSHEARQQQPLDFSDYSSVFKTRSTAQLLRAYAVLKACGCWSLCC
jgi:hypothetical protein